MQCPNCEAPIERIDGYCWNCGQKNKDGRITLREFFRDILENVLNIDAKIFRTIGHLCIPGKLSSRYFEGKRRQYFSPFRIFFITAIIFFGLLSLVISKGINEEEDAFSENEILRIGFWEAFQHELDTARDNTLQMFPEIDSLPVAMDTLYAQLPDYGSKSRYIEYFYLDDNWMFQERRVNLSYEELARYTPEELADRKEVKTLLGRAIFQQLVRLNTDSKAFVLFMVKNLIWMVLVMMVALSLLLKLLYIRRSRYLIEHLVFAFHYHSFAFILYTIALAIAHWTDADSWLSWAFLGIMIYLFVAMRRFYRQGIFKTIVKLMILNFSYLFIFIFSLALTFIVSIFIF